MSQIVYSANLSSNDFPLLSQLGGRTVIIGKIDQDYELDVNSVSKLQKEKKVPQVFYCHNTFPTGQGYQSVGFTLNLSPFVGKTDFGRIYPFTNLDGDKFLHAPSGGKNYIFDGTVNSWASISPIVGHETALVTFAYIDGHTYVFYENVGCFEYDTATKTLLPVTLIGLISTSIRGIFAASGYLHAFDEFFIYRGQAVAILDFTPNPALGSGAAIPQDLKGEIVVAFPINGGFVVYTNKNAVGASFTNNIQFPFIYKEVEGSSGIMSADHVSWQDSLGEHYAWTLSGMQKVGRTKATAVFTEVTDFFAAKLFEDFNTVAFTFSLQKLTEQLNVMITVVGNRWIVMSYGVAIGVFTHALVYDLAFKRMGKVKITHVGAFEYQLPNLYGETTWNGLFDLTWEDLGDTTWNDFATQVSTVEQQKGILAFSQKDGTVYTVDFGQEHSGDSGAIILGKYQYVRERLIALDEVDIENADISNNFDVRILTSLDGKNTDYITAPYLDINRGQYKKYLTGAVPVGMNHAVCGVGTYHLLSMELTFHQDGRT